MSNPKPPLANIVTLGVRSFVTEREFYRRLHWPQIFDSNDFAVFELRGILLALFPVDQLAADARARAEGDGGGIRFSIIINAETRDEVDEIVTVFRKAGALISKPPTDAEFFDGRSAYVSDPEGNYWEIAWAADQRNSVVMAARRAAGLPTSRATA